MKALGTCSYRGVLARAVSGLGVGPGREWRVGDSEDEDEDDDEEEEEEEEGDGFGRGGAGADQAGNRGGGDDAAAARGGGGGGAVANPAEAIPLLDELDELVTQAVQCHAASCAAAEVEAAAAGGSGGGGGMDAAAVAAREEALMELRDQVLAWLAMCQLDTGEPAACLACVAALWEAGSGLAESATVGAMEARARAALGDTAAAVAALAALAGREDAPAQLVWEAAEAMLGAAGPAAEPEVGRCGPPWCRCSGGCPSVTLEFLQAAYDVRAAAAGGGGGVSPGAGGSGGGGARGAGGGGGGGGGGEQWVAEASPPAAVRRLWGPRRVERRREAALALAKAGCQGGGGGGAAAAAGSAPPCDDNLAAERDVEPPPAAGGGGGGGSGGGPEVEVGGGGGCALNSRLCFPDAVAAVSLAATPRPSCLGAAQNATKVLPQPGCVPYRSADAAADPAGHVEGMVLDDTTGRTAPTGYSVRVRACVEWAQGPGGRGGLGRVGAGTP
ncbi:hypothetical protein HYH02_004237 [Chlamydomonas schloesseri]|uniref:Uncharacterized protein n=1 Tax=Chlamydomonas schloesseri TaxID=2026947 RepID=A0A836B902_9CHLO|nr:hypothetical protein HYH02_004237 [Chlamydomonas schloesseri]|eukprot:KAG2450965.1 hypothetical protein HYH02_004237 [Chlamydomonas schloesseri]